MKDKLWDWILKLKLARWKRGFGKQATYTKSDIDWAKNVINGRQSKL